MYSEFAFIMSVLRFLQGQTGTVVSKRRIWKPSTC